MKTLLLAIIIWTLSACNLPENKESVNAVERQEVVLTTDWKKINAFAVEFYIPPDLKEIDLKDTISWSELLPPDAPVKCYGNTNIWLVFIIQEQPSNAHKLSKKQDFQRLSKERDFKLEKTIVDGKQAEISTFKGADMQNETKGKEYVALLDVPQIENEKSLAMWIYSKTPEDRETVIKIFKSVRFLNK